MKKSLLVILSIVITLAVISCKGEPGAAGAAGPTGPTGNPGADVGVIPTNATILINDNFDRMAIGTTPTVNSNPWRRAVNWNSTLSMYHHVTDTAFVSYDRAVKLVTNSSTLDRQIVKAPFLTTLPSTTSGKIYISFYVNKAESTKGKGFVFYINQLEKLRIDFNDSGNIAYFTTGITGCLNSALFGRFVA